VVDRLAVAELRRQLLLEAEDHRQAVAVAALVVEREIENETSSTGGSATEAAGGVVGSGSFEVFGIDFPATSSRKGEGLKAFAFFSK